MRIDLGLVLAIIIQYILFIFYADTLFERKRNKWVCYTIIALGHIVNMISCMFGNVFFNFATSILAYILCFFLCYNISLKNAIFQGALLAVLIGGMEYFVVCIPAMGVIPIEPSLMTPIQSMLLTLMSRTIYLFIIMILSHIFVKDRQRSVTISFGLMIIPLCTSIILLLLFYSPKISQLLAACVLLLVVISIVAFITNQKMMSKDIEIQQLHDAERKQELEDLYNKVCGIRHDLKNHFAAIDALIDEEPQKAHEYIKSLTQNQLQSIIKFVKTDNDSFNAIANAKIAVCEREGIKVQTRIKNNSLSRLTDDEIGIIFGNLFDNAIEAARQTEDKQINLDVTVKGEYLSIIMTNSVQGSVLADNKSLETTKKNKLLHGYGTKNINRIVKKYDGMINYFEENGLFGCQILI